MLTQSELKSILHYDEFTGIFTRLKSEGGVVAGSICNSHNNEDYIVTRISNKRYSAHRLAFLYMLGAFPANQVDHKNGIKSDNAWSNLREATNSENAQNKRKHMSNNTVGYLGVGFHVRDKNFVARITINGKLKYLGSFATAKDASERYLAEKRKLHTFCTI